MLNSAGHEILNAHKYKNIKKYSYFGSYKHGILINVKMATIVGILTFISWEISCSAELSMNFYNLGPDITGRSVSEADEKTMVRNGQNHTLHPALNTKCKGKIKPVNKTKQAKRKTNR